MRPFWYNRPPDPLSDALEHLDKANEILVAHAYGKSPDNNPRLLFLIRERLHVSQSLLRHIEFPGEWD